MNQLDLQKTATSFGLAVPPRVNLNVKVSGKTARKSQLKDKLGGKRTSREGGASDGAKQSYH